MNAFYYGIPLFLLSGFIPYFGKMLCRKLPTDIGSLLALIIRKHPKNKNGFSVRFALLSSWIFMLLLKVEIVSNCHLGILAILAFSLSILIYTDERDYLLPDAFTYLILVLGLYNALISNTMETAIHGMIAAFILTIAVGFLTSIKHDDAFGGGDTKLIIAFGTFLGVSGISFLIFFSLPFFIFERISRKKKYIPYGPSLIAAFLLVIYLQKHFPSLTIF